MHIIRQERKVKQSCLTSPSGRRPKKPPRATLLGIPSENSGAFFSCHLPETCVTSGHCTKIEETDEPDDITTHAYSHVPIYTSAQPGPPPKGVPDGDLVSDWSLSFNLPGSARHCRTRNCPGRGQSRHVDERVIGLKNVSSIAWCKSVAAVLSIPPTPWIFDMRG